MGGNRVRRVLDVGQCQADHAAIRELIRSTFGAKIEYAADIRGALRRMCEDRFDLVLVNRILDATLDEGAELIKKMKESEFLREVPVMLVSNFAPAQAEATALGAVEGFGKAHLDSDETRALLERYLATDPRDPSSAR